MYDRPTTSDARHSQGNPVTARRGFFWLPGDRVEVAQGSAPRGQMFVQWEAPPEVTKPFPIVLVHGGGGQGVDWLGTPDGRPGWATFLLEEGYAVYVVDRPGHGRSPYHSEVLGPMGGAFTYEIAVAVFTSAAGGPMAHPTAHLHTQWPGSGAIDDPNVAQFTAAAGPMPVDFAAAQMLEQRRGAELLDAIGPAILMTHSAGGPMGWLTADARPELVKAIVAVEPIGPAFLVNPMLGVSLDWGLTAAPMTYDPPATAPGELSQETRDGVTLQADPARKLSRLGGIPIALVDAEASLFAHAGAATVAFLEQAGCSVDHLALADHGVHGNGHLMMLERNNREALAPILRWLDDAV